MSSFSCNEDLCSGCGTCVFVCPKHLLTLEDRHPVMSEENADKCTECGQCVAFCPEGAAEQEISEGKTLGPSLPYDIKNKSIIDGALKSRRSYRTFAKRPVSSALIEEILEVANLAPSGRNARFLRWIVLPTPTKIREFNQTALNWLVNEAAEDSAFIKRYNPESMIELLKNGKDPFFCGAPAAIFLVGDKNQRWGEIDCAIAATYFNLAAEARNIGCCFAGRGTNIAQASPALRQLLEVRDNESVYIGLFFGHKTVQAHHVPARGPVPVTFL